MNAIQLTTWSEFDNLESHPVMFDLTPGSLSEEVSKVLKANTDHLKVVRVRVGWNQCYQTTPSLGKEHF